jgi:hypothetical protein
MTEKNDRMSLKTKVSEDGDVSSGPGTEARSSTHPVDGSIDDGGLPLLGLFAVGFGLLSIFTIAPVFVPLGLILGVIALFVGQIGFGFAAIVLSVIGLVSSPTLMTIVGFGAFFAWLGL